MTDAFLSYARGDEAQARQLKELLESKGYSVAWDRDLLPGPDYSQQIETAVRAARCVVVLWTQESARSRWVREEATMGRDQGKLVPARLEEMELPLGFRLSQTVDLRGWIGDADHPGIQQLEAGIRALLGETPPPGPAPAKARRWMARLGLLAPSLLAAAIVGALALWPVRTVVEADVLATRFGFHTSAAEPPPLFQAMPVRSLTLRGFGQVQFPRGADTRVAGANASLAGDARLVLRPSGEEPARISIHPVETGGDPGGDPGESLSIDGVSAPSAEVTVDVPEPGSLGVTVRGADVSAGASMSAEVQTIATDCAGSAAGWPLEKPSVTLRSRVSPLTGIWNSPREVLLCGWFWDFCRLPASGRWRPISRWIASISKNSPQLGWRRARSSRAPCSFPIWGAMQP